MKNGLYNFLSGLAKEFDAIKIVANRFFPLNLTSDQF